MKKKAQPNIDDDGQELERINVEQVFVSFWQLLLRGPSIEFLKVFVEVFHRKAGNDHVVPSQAPYETKFLAPSSKTCVRGV